MSELDIKPDPKVPKTVWRFLRRRKGLSLLEAADGIGMDVARFSQIERLKCQATNEEMERYLAFILGDGPTA